MKLLLNCSNLRFGGGKTVGLNIIKYYQEKENIQLFIIAPAGCGYEIFKGQQPKIKIVLLSSFWNASVLKLCTNYLILPFLTFISRCNFVLSLGNVAFPCFKPQFVLIHQPYLAYPESLVWSRIKANDRRFFFYISNMLRFIKMNLKFAQYFGVQTETMKGRINSLYKIPLEKIFVIPNAISFTSMQTVSTYRKHVNASQVKLLFLSKYYPHKNFEILIKLASIIKEKSLPISFTVTINEGENEGARQFLSMVKQHQFEHIIINIDNVKLENIAEVYDEHDGLFLPTLLESFSGTYIESMYFGKPIFTSNMDFAVDVCKDAAFYFDPFDAEDIIKTIVQAFQNPEMIIVKVNSGKKIVQNTKSWNDIGEYIDDQILFL